MENEPRARAVAGPEGRGATLAVLLLTLLPRLAVFAIARLWDPAIAATQVVVGDAAGYHARALAAFGPHGFYPPMPALDLIRPPVYPLLLALLYRVAGVVPWHALLVNALLAALTNVLLHRAAKDAIGPRAAMVVAVVFAFDPSLVLLSNMLLCEVLYLLLCVAALAALRAPLEERFAPHRFGAYAAAGALLGLATLTRPAAQALPLVLAIVFALRAWRTPARPALAALVLVVAFVATLSPWMLRNRAVYGVASVSEIQVTSPLFKVYVGPIEAAKTGQTEEESEARLERESEDLARADGLDPSRMNGFQMSPYWKHLLVRYVAHDPGTYARSAVRKSLLFFGNVETASWAKMLHFEGGGTDLGQWRHRSFGDDVRMWFATKTPGEKWVGLWNLLWLAATYTCLAFGVVVAARRGMGAVLAACAVLALYFIVSGAPVGEARFRTSALVFYLPFVGIGAEHLWSRMRPRAARGPA